MPLLGTFQNDEAFTLHGIPYRVFLQPLDYKYLPTQGEVLCLNLQTHRMEWLKRREVVSRIQYSDPL